MDTNKAAVEERYIFDEANFRKDFISKHGCEPYIQTIKCHREITEVVNEIVERELKGDTTSPLPAYIIRK